MPGSTVTASPTSGPGSRTTSWRSAPRRSSCTGTATRRTWRTRGSPEDGPRAPGRLRAKPRRGAGRPEQHDASRDRLRTHPPRRAAARPQPEGRRPGRLRRHQPPRLPRVPRDLDRHAPGRLPLGPEANPLDRDRESGQLTEDGEHLNAEGTKLVAAEMASAMGRWLSGRTAGPVSLVQPPAPPLEPPSP